MLLRDAKLQRQRRAWMISQIMAEKERLARLRLTEINTEQPLLKQTYLEYLELYKKYIQPLSSKVDRYFSNIHEKRKIEHFLQGQAQHVEATTRDQQRTPNIGAPGARSWTLPPQVEKLPYAGPNDVGRAPKKAKPLNEDEAKAILKEVKKLDPKVFAELLKQIGVK